MRIPRREERDVDAARRHAVGDVGGDLLPGPVPGGGVGHEIGARIASRRPFTSLAACHADERLVRVVGVRERVIEGDANGAGPLPVTTSSSMPVASSPVMRALAASVRPPKTCA